MNVRYSGFFSLITLILFISFVARFYLIDQFVYWQDEGYTAWFVSQSFRDLLFWVPTFDANPPFYYILLKFWNYFFSDYITYSERYFSLFLLLPLYYFTARTIQAMHGKNNISLLFIVLIISLSPVISWYALEARVYMLMAVCYALTIYAFVRIVQSKNVDKVAWIYISLGALSLNWTHSTGAIQSLIIFAVLSTHIIIFARDKFRYLLYSLLFVFIFSLPLALMVYKQLQVWGEGTWIQEPTIRSFYYFLQGKFILFDGEKLLANILGVNSLAQNIAWFLKSTTLLIVALCAYIALSKKNLTLIYLLIITFVLPIIYFVISVVGPNILLGRALIGLQLSYLVFIVAALSFIKNKKVSIVILSFVFLQILISNIEQINYKTKEPWSDVYAYLKSNVGRNDSIFLLPNAVFMPLVHLNKEFLEEFDVVNLPYEFPAIKVSDFYPAGMPSVPGLTENDLSQVKKYINSRKGKIFVLVRAESLYDPNKLLHRSLSDNSMILDQQKQFKNITIYNFGR